MKKIVWGILACFLVIKAAWADIPPPPPPPAIVGSPNGTPVEVSLSRQQVAQGNKVYFRPQPRVDSNDRIVSHWGSATKSGNTVTATKSHPATFTDNYGNKASGTVRTQTRIPNNAVAKGFGAIMVGTTATTHLDNLKRQGVADQISRGFSDGDWTAVAAGVGKIFDWTGFGSSVADAIYGDSTAAEAVAAPLREQALRQARTDFDNAQRQRQQIDPTATYTHVVVREWGGVGENSVDPNMPVITEYIVKGFAPWSHAQTKTKDWPSPITINGTTITNKLPADQSHWMSINNTTISGKDAANIQAKINANIENYMPDQAAWEKAMEQFLNQSNANNAAITDLINALWQTGAINPQNTQTTVAGSAGDNTFVTEPYTPVGSDQAQQTQFRVNPDGSVTVSTIPRPDLPANTSAAPQRAETGKPSGNNEKAQQNEQQGQSGKDKDSNICKANPKSIACAEMGSADYEDLSLPERKINLNFNPANVFNTDGSCPPPKVLSVAGRHFTVSYEPICDFARGARPMMILLGIVLAMAMAYAAVKEL